MQVQLPGISERVQYLFNTQESMQIVIGHSMIAAKVCHSRIDATMLEMVYCVNPTGT